MTRQSPSIKELQKKVFKTATDHGWWENPVQNLPEKLALMHSELSEALEEYRNGTPDSKGWSYAGENGKPEGFGTELADCIIRILDLSEYLGIDMETLVIDKMAYNETRPYRHGGKKA